MGKRFEFGAKETNWILEFRRHFSPNQFTDDGISIEDKFQQFSKTRPEIFPSFEFGAKVMD